MTKHTIPTSNGFSIIGTFVLLALVPLIYWGLNFIISRDFTEATSPKNVTKNIPPPTSSSALTILSTSTVSVSTALATTSPTTPTAIKTTTVQTPTPPKTIAPAPVGDKTVTFTDKGFSPATVSIVRGQSITFVNNSSSKMWVAANPFPTSKEYPEFNEKEGVESGKSWTFTFDESGTWFYHSHYSPAIGGKVVVSWK